MEIARYLARHAIRSWYFSAKRLNKPAWHLSAIILRVRAAESSADFVIATIIAKCWIYEWRGTFPAVIAAFWCNQCARFESCCCAICILICITLHRFSATNTNTIRSWLTINFLRKRLACWMKWTINLATNGAQSQWASYAVTQRDI